MTEPAASLAGYRWAAEYNPAGSPFLEDEAPPGWYVLGHAPGADERDPPAVTLHVASITANGAGPVDELVAYAVADTLTAAGMLVHDSTTVDSAEHGAEDEATDVSGETLGSAHSPEQSVHDEDAIRIGADA